MYELQCVCVGGGGGDATGKGEKKEKKGGGGGGGSAGGEWPVIRKLVENRGGCWWTRGPNFRS